MAVRVRGNSRGTNRSATVFQPILARVLVSLQRLAPSLVRRRLDPRMRLVPFGGGGLGALPVPIAAAARSYAVGFLRKRESVPGAKAMRSTPNSPRGVARYRQSAGGVRRREQSSRWEGWRNGSHESAACLRGGVFI